MLPSSRPAAAFTQPQLKQFRAQCLVFLAFRNQLVPRQLHLEIALGLGLGLGGRAPAPQPQGETEVRADGDGETSSRTQASSSAAQLPLPHLLPVSSLRLSATPATEQDDDRADVHDG